jgi:transcriptional regulator with XRE-family HTH domain
MSNVGDYHRGRFLRELRQYRLDKHIKQTTLARTIGVVPQSLANWENGRSLPTVEDLHTWAAALGVTVPEGLEGFRSRKHRTR